MATNGNGEQKALIAQALEGAYITIELGIGQRRFPVLFRRPTLLELCALHKTALPALPLEEAQEEEIGIQDAVVIRGAVPIPGIDPEKLEVGLKAIALADKLLEALAESPRLTREHVLSTPDRIYLGVINDEDRASAMSQLVAFAGYSKGEAERISPLSETAGA